MDIQHPIITLLSQLAPTMSKEDIITCILKPRMSLIYDRRQVALYSKQNLTDFQNTLQQNQTIDTEESSQQTNEKLEQLEEIVKKWSLDIAEKEQRVHRDQLKQCAAILLPYGSILLGVNDSKSDVDLICVAPQYIERHLHFFQGLFEILAATPGVEQINKIESTTNPIIKMIFRGLHIDMNFAQLNSDTIPKNIDEALDELRQSLFPSEEKSINALNGRKNGIFIRESVRNKQQFVESLKIIKLWSKKRGITGNILGYLGGISWAIMVSKVCQLFPDLDPFLTVCMFFQVYSNWNWKTAVIIDDSDIENKFSNQSWKDEPEKRVELMKVITPAIPYLNSTFKVSNITFNTIYAELQRGAKIDDWHQLIEEFDFCGNFKNYVTVSIVANDKENFHKWIGFCEAQLPKLLKLMSHEEKNLSMEDGYRPYDVRINPKPFENLEKDYDCSLSYLIGIKKLDPIAWPLFLRQPITKFSMELLSRKNALKFSETTNSNDYNMKIYLQNAVDFQKITNSSPLSCQSIVEDPIQKKIKLERNQSVELIKRMDSEQKDPNALRNALDEMF